MVDTPDLVQIWKPDVACTNVISHVTDVNNGSGFCHGPDADPDIDPDPWRDT